MNKALLFIHKNATVVLVTVLAFTAGVLVAEATRQDLTLATCKTDEECRIAEDIAFHADQQLPLSIPVLEPSDCSDLKGEEKTACEQSNRDNAGKPAIYPTSCEPYIFEAPKG